jgi:hypothetical protein
VARPTGRGSSFDDKDVHDKNNAGSRRGIVVDDGSRDGDGTRRRRRCRWCQQQGRDRHSDGKPADEHPGDWYRNECEARKNAPIYPDRKPDWVDAASCDEYDAVLGCRRQQKLTPPIRRADRAADHVPQMP